jgi:hypothetical protein
MVQFGRPISFLLQDIKRYADNPVYFQQFLTILEPVMPKTLVQDTVQNICSVSVIDFSSCWQNLPLANDDCKFKMYK